MQIKFNGNVMNLRGEQLKVGDKAPDFNATTKDMEPFSLSEVKTKYKVLSVVPSLDTPVCQIQTKKFNAESEKLADTTVITISLDLPFAQQRFCDVENIKRGVIISDYKNREVAEKYGLLIEELGVLTRAIFVLDENNEVIYVEYVEEITNEPDYEKVLAIVS